MKQCVKTITSILLAVLMVTSVFIAVPFSASAAEISNDDIGSAKGITGSCSWTLDNEGVLTISGNGDMDNYNDDVNPAPWGTSVTNVIIENGVTSIGERAFKNCKKLNCITIPKSVTSIGVSAFLGCAELNQVHISDLAVWCKISFAFDSFGDLSSNPLTYAHRLYLNNQLLTKLSIPESLTSVSYSAFAGCTELTSVTIPSNVRCFGSFVFKDCIKLNAVYIDDIVNWCRMDFKNEYANPLFYAHNLYLNNKLISNFVVPEGVKGIGAYTFEKCSKLTSVVIPDSATRIADYAFEGCTNLNNAKIGNGVTKIGEFAFSNCSGLKSITIPNNVKTISNTALNNCPSDMTIYGKTGSTAQTFAKTAGFTFFDESTPIVIDPTNVTLNKTDISLEIGKSYKLIATIKPSDATNKTITWTSDKTNIATVSNGVVTAKAKGTAKIVATSSNGKKAICNVVVTFNAPKLTKVENVYGGVKVSWNKNGADKYRIYHKTGNESWQKVGDTTDNNYVDKSVKTNTNYTFTVRCISADAKSFTSGFDAKGLSIKYIAAPVINKIENVATGIKMSWNKVAGAAKYRVFVKNGSSWKKLGDTTGNNYTATKLKSGTTYTYTVRCLDKNNKFISNYNGNGWSQKFIAVPQVTSLSNTNSGVVVKMSKPAGATYIRVFRKTGKESWKGLGNTSSTSFTDKPPKKGTTYSYTARCITANGKTFTSAYNNTGKSIKTVKGAPSKISVSPGSKTITAGSTFKLSYSIPKDAYSGTVTYYSSNNNVASVNQSGVVSGRNKGTAYITAKSYNGKTASCKVTVNPKPQTKEDRARSNFNYLKSYIYNHYDGINSSNNRFIKFTDYYDYDGSFYSFGIVYNTSSNKLELILVDDSSSTTIALDFNRTFTINPNVVFIFSNGTTSFDAKASFDARNYYKGKSITFNWTYVGNLKGVNVADLCAVNVDLLLTCADYMISKRAGLHLSDIGFFNFKV